MFTGHGVSSSVLLSGEACLIPQAIPGFAEPHASGSSIAQSSGATYSWMASAGSPRRAKISGMKGDVPRTLNDRNRPLRAETDDLSEFTNSRSRGRVKPSSSKQARSNPARRRSWNRPTKYRPRLATCKPQVVYSKTLRWTIMSCSLCPAVWVGGPS